MPDKNANVLMIMTDQQRFDSLSCYGCEVTETPNLDKLAQSGVLFERCYVNNQVCTPSRASILTGKPLTGHGVFQLHDNLPEDEILFPARLQERGYQTALIGKLHVSGRMTEAKRRHPHDGFEVYEWCLDPTIHLDSPYNAYAAWLRAYHSEFLAELVAEGRGMRHFPADVHFNRWAVERTCAFLDGRDKDRPFFCFMSLFDPHDPYFDCPSEWLDAVDQSRIPNPQPAETDGTVPTAIRLEQERSADILEGRKGYKDLREIQTGYYGSVAHLDHEIGRLIEYLNQSGLIEKTLIVFLSDHGDMLGDRRLLGKGPYFYDPCTRVPLIVRVPDGRSSHVPSGSRYPGVVQPSDVAATVLSYAGLTKEELRQIMPHSKDLMAMVANSEPAREVAVCEYRNTGYGTGGRYYDPEVHCTMICDGQYKLCVYQCAENDDSLRMGELYDTISDPLETNNLWGVAEFGEVRLRLLLRLIDWNTDVEKTYIGGRGGEFAPWHV